MMPLTLLFASSNVKGKSILSIIYSRVMTNNWRVTFLRLFKNQTNLKVMNLLH